MTRLVPVMLFWIIAAMLVVVTHNAVAGMAALLAIACAYTRLVARHAGITHALGVGITWLVLSIATELALRTHALLGPLDRPLLRNVMLFVWIFGPALFARRDPLRNH